MADVKDAQKIKDFVRGRYARLAREKSSCCGPATSTAKPQKEASALYSPEELRQLPTEAAEMSMGCGNPTAIAELKEGEVVLDLGSGGGIDCLLAAQRVGPKGRAIGLDMTPQMVALARANAAKAGLPNVEFRLGEMERMPIEDSSVDVIISNCVINLSSHKDAVFREAFRVLKPGGRLAVSDIVLLRELPAEVAGSPEAWAGCVAGALSVKEYRDKLKAARFEAVEVTGKGLSIPGYKSLEGLVASADIRARKPEFS